MLKLEKYVEEISDKCILCNKTLKSILIKNSHILANVFLNNYSKLVNDQISTQNKDPSKRKLLKFKSETYKTHGGLLARPPQEPTHLLGTSQVMWKALFIVFFFFIIISIFLQTIFSFSH
jgi:hypothetical protein